MSTEPRIAPSATRGPAPDARRFRRLLYGSIGILSLLIAALVAANLTQGPRLTTAQINLNTSVERAGQRLLLQANEPLAAIDSAQVTVSPAVKATASVSAASVDVQFADTLRYNTTYTVTVHDVKSVAATAASEFTYSFRTPDPTVYYLVPGEGSGSEDQIKSGSLSGGDPVTVYSAPHIRRFAAFPQSLVVNTVNDDNTDSLTIVSLTGAAPVPVMLAADGTVTSLKALTGSKLFGYTYTTQASPYYTVAPELLFAYDLTRGQDYTIPISGTDHEQFSVKDWRFVPGTTSLVAQTLDSSLLLVDTLGERDGTSGPIPIGRADTLDGFVSGTKQLLTTTGGTTSATDLGSPDHPTVAADAGLPDDSASRAASAVATAAGLGPITSLCLSPNAKYAAITTSAADGSPRVTYFEIDTATVLSTVDGTEPDWCATG
jgi:hypothetical protein